MDVGDVPELVAACCILHNICKIHGDLFDEEWLKGVENTSEITSATASTVQPQDTAVAIRNALASHFTN